MLLCCGIRLTPPKLKRESIALCVAVEIHPKRWLFD